VVFFLPYRLHADFESVPFHSQVCSVIGIGNMTPFAIRMRVSDGFEKQFFFLNRIYAVPVVWTRRKCMPYGTLGQMRLDVIEC
jgi:hypothetical protein